jgi:glycosyltransferase involved in cell wall biosynthesis
MTPTLSVVLPVYNERAQDLHRTLTALSDELRSSPWTDPEVVIVDDGSDPPLSVPHIPGACTRVIRQTNRGRFEARRTGIEAAAGEYVLLLDARVTLEPGGLLWVAERVQNGERVWNGHCLIANLHSPYARFWNVLTYAAFAEYFENPRTTSFGLEEYDRFPKGTTQFLAPRTWLLEAIEGFGSRYEDLKFSNDDTLMLRELAARDRIHISPHFASGYRSREALRPFLRHAMHRGTVFYDGFSRPDTRFFPAVVAAFPLSLTGILLAVRRPRVALGAAVAFGASGGAVARMRGRPSAEALSFGALVGPFAVAFSAGVWRGAWLASRSMLRS